MKLSDTPEKSRPRHIVQFSIIKSSKRIKGYLDLMKDVYIKEGFLDLLSFISKNMPLYLIPINQLIRRGST